MVNNQEENIGADRVFTKKIGFIQGQHDALSGMGTMLPRSTLWRLRRKNAIEIARKVREELAPAVLAQCADFAIALREPESRIILENRLQLMENTVTTDMRIGNITGDPDLIEFAKKERLALENIKPIN